MKSGIYLIENVINNKKYVGQSLNVAYRISKHKCCLRKNTHENQYLQRSFVKYGEENFQFTILEYCEVEMLDEREVFYINFFDSMNFEKGFNLESGGNLGKIVSESTREKKRGENNPMYNKKATEKTRLKMKVSSRGKNAKLTDLDVVKVKELLIKGLQQREIANMFSVNLSTINKIATFKNWGYIRPDLNQKYLQVKEEREKILIENTIHLLNQGYSFRKIEEILNVDRRKLREIKIITDNTEITK